MEHDGYYQFGTIVKTHGVKGNVVVRLDVDDPSRYKVMGPVSIETPQGLETFPAKTISVTGDHLILHLEGVEDMDAAELLVKSGVFLPVTSLPRLNDKKLYLHEAVGMRVIDSVVGDLGVIEKIYDLPEQPVASLTFKSKEVLFPLLSVFIERVDRDQRILHLNLPDGLIDLYTS